jgi:hypothetical protein
MLGHGDGAVKTECLNGGPMSVGQLFLPQHTDGRSKLPATHRRYRSTLAARNKLSRHIRGFAVAHSGKPLAFRGMHIICP